MATCHRTGHLPCTCFERVDTWVFDLDNTLYPSQCNLFDQVSQRMGEFVSKELGISLPEAKALQRRYYHEHGTTLAGLMRVNQVDPHRFLAHVHDIDYSPVPAAPDLVRALEQLPGRRIIFTNGSRRHAEKVAERLGATHLFADIFDIADAGFVPKPQAEAYHSFLASHGVDAATSAMFEDLPQNLEAPHALGMATVLVHTHLDDHPIYAAIRGWGSSPPAHVHHSTHDIAVFLAGMLETLGRSHTARSPAI